MTVNNRPPLYKVYVVWHECLVAFSRNLEKKTFFHFVAKVTCICRIDCFCFFSLFRPSERERTWHVWRLFRVAHEQKHKAALLTTSSSAEGASEDGQVPEKRERKNSFVKDAFDGLSKSPLLRKRSTKRMSTSGKLLVYSHSFIHSFPADWFDALYVQRGAKTFSPSSLDSILILLAPSVRCARQKTAAMSEWSNVRPFSQVYAYVLHQHVYAVCVCFTCLHSTYPNCTRCHVYERTYVHSNPVKTNPQKYHAFSFYLSG